jgi:hypothetical protein
MKAHQRDRIMKTTTIPAIRAQVRIVTATLRALDAVLADAEVVERHGDRALSLGTKQTLTLELAYIDRRLNGAVERAAGENGPTADVLMN